MAKRNNTIKINKTKQISIEETKTIKMKEQEQKNEIIQSRLEVVDLLSKPLHENTIVRINNWLQANADKFIYKNEKYNLKTGDVITFKNGEDIPMRSKIIAFNAKNGNAYVFWDCFWVDLDLEKRLIKPSFEKQQ